MKAVAKQLLKAIRGKRSQVAFSRRLGYRSNVAADWEIGRRFPTGAETLRACTRVGIDILAALTTFAPVGANLLSGLTSKEALSPMLLAQWLETLRGERTLESLATHCGTTRYSVGRWLNGKTQPRLPQFLTLLDGLTGRVADLLARLVPIEQIPALLKEQQQRMTLRELAFAEPWTEAVLRILETRDYNNLKKHSDAWIAAYLNIDEATVFKCLSLLHEASVIVFREGKYALGGILSVDTKTDPARFMSLQAHWAQVSGARILKNESTDITSYNVFSCSHADMARIRELHRAYYHQVRAIVAASEPVETVGLLKTSLFAWEPPKTQ